MTRFSIIPTPVHAEVGRYSDWRVAKVSVDYHISVDKHLYSVPYQLVGEQVDVRLSSTTVEILHKNRRVASHLRSYKQGGFTTNPDHRPKSHQRYLEWTPSRIISWAQTKGPRTAAPIARILQSKPHPEQGYRSCLGIIRLADKFTLERVEAASERAIRCDTISYPFAQESARDIFEIMEGRSHKGSVVVVSPPQADRRLVRHPRSADHR